MLLKRIYNQLVFTMVIAITSVSPLNSAYRRHQHHHAYRTPISGIRTSKSCRIKKTIKVMTIKQSPYGSNSIHIRSSTMVKNCRQNSMRRA